MTKPPRKSAKRTRRPPPYAGELVHLGKKLVRIAEKFSASRASQRAAGAELVRQWKSDFRQIRMRTGIPFAPGADASPATHELCRVAALIVAKPYMLPDHPMAPLLYFMARDYLAHVPSRAQKPPSATVAQMVDHLIDDAVNPKVNPTAAWRRVAQMVGKDVDAVRLDHSRYGTVKPMGRRKRQRRPSATSRDK
jgi:hypothetical protein